MNNLIEGLTDAGHQVKVLAANTNKYHTNLEDIPGEYKQKTGIELEYIDLAIKPLDAFLNLFTNKSYHVERFKSKAFENKLIKTLQEHTFDVVQIELLYMSPYLETIRKYSKAKVVLRAHNIEHLIWKRLTTSETNPLKKFYLTHLTRTLELYEHNILDQYDGIVPITEKDAGYFNSVTSTPVKAVSFGIDAGSLSVNKAPEPDHAAFHIGSMNWMPNEEGVHWFLEKVWPIIREKETGLKIYLAGREMPPWLTSLNQHNVEVVGEVPDAKDFVLSKTICIAPLLSGSGIRIKIIESMALGRAVISTTVGAEGINYQPGRDILIADSPEDFASAVLELYQNPEKCSAIGKQARDLILKEHDTKKIIHRLVAFYREIF
jgi:glycosyltransferase involved in cell wall biosynthesis